MTDSVARTCTGTRHSVIKIFAVSKIIPIIYAVSSKSSLCRVQIASCRNGVKNDHFESKYCRPPISRRTQVQYTIA